MTDEKPMDPEVAALAAAYAAITSRPSDEWPRMLNWLSQRLQSDARTKPLAARSADDPR